jgi:YrbI family 3-deoxy-D-manno-octulosonate 8-phosphate phosphatase
MNLPSWENVHTIAFDFDGIFTDNKVYSTQEGIEIIRSDKSDSLGLDILKKFIKKKEWDLDYFIISREKNNVVSERAKKLGIKCFSNINNKKDFLFEYLSKKNGNIEDVLGGFIFLGNDLNDLEAINLAGYSIAPIDCHPIIKKNVDLIIDKEGGNGFVREFIEILIKINEFDKKDLAELI